MELSLFENYLLSSTKNNKKYSKKCTKNKSVCFNDVMWLMAMKMRLNMKNKSHQYDINRSRPRHGRKYTKQNLKFNSWKLRLSWKEAVLIKGLYLFCHYSSKKKGFWKNIRKLCNPPLRKSLKKTSLQITSAWKKFV